MIGPGKYDAEATAARQSAEAKGVVLIVAQGNRGSGFSVQAPLELILGLPRMLRELADGIEADRTKA